MDLEDVVTHPSYIETLEHLTNGEASDILLEVLAELNQRRTSRATRLIPFVSQIVEYIVELETIKASYDEFGNADEFAARFRSGDDDEEEDEDEDD
jgi:hypothetical protein